ncbi:MAG: DUF4040 domain-containing protein [Proteobacteria bacterium]|nr:DUF4040 domain-containing protein [Pseudomonadota bacterium]
MILLLAVAAACAPLLARRAGRGLGWLMALVPLGSAVYLGIDIAMGPHVPWAERWTWMPALGVDVSFVGDGLALLFAVLICLIGALITLYSGSYFAGDSRCGRFFAYLLAFMAAMLGVVFSDNLIVLFIFWELTSIASYALIAYKSRAKSARDAALTALLVTGAGGLALLCGFVLIGMAAVDMGVDPAQASSIAALHAVDLRSHPYYTAIVVLVLLGAFTKSAQFPFHFWLPGAMAAPTPASAYLHSATMVKAGIYLIARLQPHLGDTDVWILSITGAGAATMVIGAVVGLRQRDLKRLLAYSTVAVLGIITMLIGLGSSKAVKAALVLLCAHALYKAALFMVVGNIDHGAGTRMIDRLGGLRRRLPYTAMAALVAAISMAGLPPTLGFIGKELFYAAKLTLGPFGSGLLVVAVAANSALVVIALIVAFKPFFGPATEPAKAAHEADLSMLIGPWFLAGMGLILGLWPGLFDQILGSWAAASIVNQPVAMDLALWHGLNSQAVIVLALSALTIIGGIALYVAMRGRFRTAGTAPAPTLAESLYNGALAGLYRVGARFAAAVQNGHLTRYIAVVLLVLIAGVSIPLVGALLHPLAIEPISLDVTDCAIAALIAIGAVAAALIPTYLGAIAALGISGLGIALTFALYGAPDLALTLIVVEVLTVVVLALVFHHLPVHSSQALRSSSRIRTVRDVAIAVACGALVTGLTLASAAIHLPADAATYYSKTSVPQGYGHNIVNVILVDFRALDTLGEIVVVAVAGLGVLALLRLRRIAAARPEREAT